MAGAMDIDPFNSGSRHQPLGVEATAGGFLLVSGRVLETVSWWANSGAIPLVRT